MIVFTVRKVMANEGKIFKYSRKLLTVIVHNINTMLRAIEFLCF